MQSNFDLSEAVLSRGDGEAFEALVLRYERPVWTGCWLSQIARREALRVAKQRPQARPVGTVTKIGAFAATFVLIAVGFWVLAPRTLQAAFRDSVQQAGKVYILREMFDGANITKGEIWYHRDHGIRLEGLGQVTVDNGKVSRTWSPNEPAASLLLRPSMDGVTRISELLDTSRMPSHWMGNRSREHDQDVVELDYPEDAKIVDVQKGLDGRFPLSGAISKMEQDGIQFAIHDLLPIDDGSYHVVSSVRGSPKFTSFDEITNEAYAAELRKARWQMQTGDFTGADPPQNADGTIAWMTNG